MKRVLIRVTQRHILNGAAARLKLEQRNRSCPIALAVAETIQGDVSVLYKFVNFSSHLLASSLPVRAMRFIARFDRKKSVKPFNFYLEIP